MSTQESRRFWCFMEGRLPFYIPDIPLSTNVFELKKEIIQRTEALQGIDADRLNLRKFNKPISVDPEGDLAERLEDMGDISTYSQELSAAGKVEMLFPEPHSDEHLHILVQILPSTSRKHSLWEEVDQEAKRQKIDTGADLAWLVELHSKIWKGGKERLKTLVHEIEVTVAHYRELQRQLKTRPNKDIPTIQREILLHYKPPHTTPGNEANVSEESVDDDPELEPNSDTSDNEQDPADVNEESGDDDTELGLFLPATFKFLDLSSLKLEHEPSCLPLPLFIRPEYTFILNEIQDTNYSHMISGQPGTGKTAFLHYAMIEYMLDGIPFLYQSLDGIVYHVSEKVKIIESWDISKKIVVFVDADGTETNQHIPKRFLRYRCMHFILASSPKGTSQKWMKQIGRMKMVEFVLKLWTRQEFFVTGIFLYPKQLDLALLRESTSYFGFNPRQCFEHADSKKSLEMGQILVRNAIHSIDKSSLFDLVMETLTAKYIPSTVFEVFPLNDNRYLAQAQLRAVSQWALDELLTEYNRRQTNAALELYKILTRLPSAGPLRFDMFQLQVLKYFDSIVQPKTFRICNLATSEYLDWHCPGLVPRCAFQTRDLTAVLKESVQQKQPRHLVPLAPNYAAVDSILYEPDSVLTSLQVTITKQHPISVSGLKRIQQSLKHNTSLADLRPGTLEAKHWRLIFVVPEEDADSFTSQKFNGDTAKNAWAQKVDQYVLGLNVDNVFAAPKE